MSILRCACSAAPRRAAGRRILARAPGQRVIAATDLLPIDVADPRRLAIRGYASPLELGAEIIAALNRPGVTRAADVDGLHLLARAAACVGAFERAEALVRGSRGRPARAGTTCSAGASSGTSGMGSATPQPLARGIGRRRGSCAPGRRDAPAAAQSRRTRGQAMLAAMRGDSDLGRPCWHVQAEELSHGDRQQYHNGIDPEREGDDRRRRRPSARGVRAPVADLPAHRPGLPADADVLGDRQPG